MRAAASLPAQPGGAGAQPGGGERRGGGGAGHQRQLAPLPRPDYQLQVSESVAPGARFHAKAPRTPTWAPTRCRPTSSAPMSTSAGPETPAREQ